MISRTLLLNKSNILNKKTLYNKKNWTQKSIVRLYANSKESATLSQADELKRYNIELNKCVKMKYYEAGVRLFHEMKSKNIEPNSTTYRLVFDIYDIGDDSAGADQLLNELREKGIKTEIDELNQQIYKNAENVETRKKALSIYNEYISKRRSGVNLFEPLN